MQVTVPAGKRGGEMMCVDTPAGQVEVVIPLGLQPEQSFHFSLPPFLSALEPLDESELFTTAHLTLDRWPLTLLTLKSVTARARSSHMRPKTLAARTQGEARRPFDARWHDRKVHEGQAHDVCVEKCHRKPDGQGALSRCSKSS